MPTRFFSYPSLGYRCRAQALLNRLAFAGRVSAVMLLPLPRFQSLQPWAQLRYLMTVGTYLTHRWQGARLVNLYYLLDAGRGYFVETGRDEAQACFTVLHSFRDSEPLEDYARYAPLPE